MSVQNSTILSHCSVIRHFFRLRIDLCVDECYHRIYSLAVKVVKTSRFQAVPVKNDNCFTDISHLEIPFAEYYSEIDVHIGK
jgi:hypothetical protein